METSQLLGVCFIAFAMGAYIVDMIESIILNFTWRKTYFLIFLVGVQLIVTDPKAIVYIARIIN